MPKRRSVPVNIDLVGLFNSNLYVWLTFEYDLHFICYRRGKMTNTDRTTQKLKLYLRNKSTLSWTLPRVIHLVHYNTVIRRYQKTNKQVKRKEILSFKILQWIKLEIRPGLTPLHTTKTSKKSLSTIIYIKMKTIFIDVTSVCL